MLVYSNVEINILIRIVHLILPFLLACLAAIAFYKEWFSSLDYYLYDQVQAFNKVPNQDDVLIVAIDEKSTAELGRWPWPRKLHAQLLDELTDAQARAVVFDILFGEPNLQNPQNDDAFAAALNRSGRVILPVYFEALNHHGQLVEIPPIATFSQHTAAIGHAHIDCGIEGICRTVYLREGIGSPHWPHMALALHKVVEGASFNVEEKLPGLRADGNSDFSPMLIYRDYKNFVPFSSANRTPVVSFSDLLQGSIPHELLRDKIIFVGATATGIHDVVVTPSGRIPGVELNSLIYQAIRAGKLSQEITPGIGATYIFVSVFVLLAFFSFLPPSYFLLLTVFSAGVGVLMSAIFLLFLNVWVAPAAAIIFILVFYPLWNWAKLEFALRFLHRSLIRIQEEEKGAANGSSENDQTTMLPSNERLSKILFGSHFSVESKIKGTEVVSKTIEQFRLANRGLESARQLVLQSLANLQEAVIIFNKDGALVLKNKFAQVLFPGLGVSSNVEEIGEYLQLTDQQVWTEEVRSLVSGNSSMNLEGQIKNQRVDLYVQGRNINISRPSTNQTSSTALTNILLFTFTDITTLKNSERSRRETLDFISHDLRSPMVSILALINKQKVDVGDDSSNMAVLNEVEKYANRNLAYAESLLQLSRAEVATAENYTMNDMHAVIDAAYAHVLPVANQKNITLNVDREDKEIWVLADTDLLERALINLLTNALKFSERDTRVSMCLELNKTTAEVRVRDEGTGIDERDMTNLFQRFKRGRRKTTKDGAGLGLFFVKTVADKHGGSIKASNNNEAGATFILSIPALNATELLTS